VEAFVEYLTMKEELWRGRGERGIEREREGGHRERIKRERAWPSSEPTRMLPICLCGSLRGLFAYLKEKVKRKGEGVGRSEGAKEEEGEEGD
jgi:hypothetical protein